MLHPVLLLSLVMTHSDSPAAAAMDRLLPPSIAEWIPSEPRRVYRGREIFTYIDGAGEVYLAYSFDSVLVQRYARSGQEEILVEIFDMASPRNAFGVYTYMLGRGPSVPIGQDGEYKNGLLCFWRDRYCVYVRIEDENDRATEAVLAMGTWISGAIGTDGERPDLLRHLPGGLFDPGSLRYFYRHEILNTHFTVGDGNDFLLDDSTEAVLARLKSDGSTLLLVQYPSETRADSAYASVLAHLMPDARSTGAVRRENGKWTVSRRVRRYIIAVFDAPQRQSATNTISSIAPGFP